MSELFNEKGWKNGLELGGEKPREENPAPVTVEPESPKCDRTNVTQVEPDEKVLSVKFIADIAGKLNKSGELFNHVKVNPYAVAVQLWHETGGFKSNLMCRNFNLGGIKCTGSWIKGTCPHSNQRCFSAKTNEFYDGTKETIVAGFRSYDTLMHFLYDYSRLIFRYYPVCRDNADSVFAYFAGLHGKWATDPNYFKSLVRLSVNFATQYYGDSWKEILRQDLAKACLRDVLEAWQMQYIKDRLEG